MTRTNIILGLLGTLAAASFVTACAEEAKAPAPPETGETASATSPPSAPPTANMPRGDEQKLEPMTHAEFNGIIPSGLGCSFADRRNASPLVVAADAQRGADAVVKLNGTLVRLEATQGGHDALAAGPVLRSEALEVRILRTPGEGSQTGIETMVWPAEMVVAQDETGEIDRRQGEWMCGA
jgi:hypothetical protein